MVDFYRLSYSTHSMSLGALACVVACGSDASGRSGTAQAGDSQTGADAGSADSPETRADAGASGSDAATAGCQIGSTAPCSCPDGQSAGQSPCVDGRFADTCLGCPCREGETQVCDCPGADFGTQTCSAGAFGTCECMGVGADAGTDTPPCPEGFLCTDITGQGAVCTQTNQQFAIPPRCTDVMQCRDLGLENAVCTNVSVLGQLCLQACTP